MDAGHEDWSWVVTRGRRGLALKVPCRLTVTRKGSMFVDDPILNPKQEFVLLVTIKTTAVPVTQESVLV